MQACSPEQPRQLVSPPAARKHAQSRQSQSRTLVLLKRLSTCRTPPPTMHAWPSSSKHAHRHHLQAARTQATPTEQGLPEAHGQPTRNAPQLLQCLLRHLIVTAQVQLLQGAAGGKAGRSCCVQASVQSVAGQRAQRWQGCKARKARCSEPVCAELQDLQPTPKHKHRSAPVPASCGCLKSYGNICDTMAIQPRLGATNQTRHFSMFLKVTT